MFNVRAAARFARHRSVTRQPKPPRKEHQENSRSSLPFSLSPCSLIESTTGVSGMLARRAPRTDSLCVAFGRRKNAIDSPQSFDSLACKTGFLVKRSYLFRSVEIYRAPKQTQAHFPNRHAVRPISRKRRQETRPRDPSNLFNEWYSVLCVIENPNRNGDVEHLVLGAIKNRVLLRFSLALKSSLLNQGGCLLDHSRRSVNSQHPLRTRLRISNHVSPSSAAEITHAFVVQISRVFHHPVETLVHVASN